MAIQIIKSLDYTPVYNGDTYTSKFIAGYNTNIIRWTTDSALPTLVGRKTKIEIQVSNASTISVGNQFTIDCDGTIIAFDVVSSPSTTNQIYPRNHFAMNLAGMVAYETHIKAVMNAHPVISTKFIAAGWYSNTSLMRWRFESLINTNIVLTATVITGTYSFSNSITQVGALDFQSEMRGEIWFNGIYKFVDLTADSDNNIEFDIKEVVKTIFGKFDDTTTYQNSDIVKFDANLFLKLQIKLRIVFTDPGTATDEELDTVSYITRAVRQHTDLYKTSMFFYEPNRIFNLSTSDAKTLALIRNGVKSTAYSQHLRIFKGFPIDISVIAEYTNDQLFFALNRMDGITLNYLSKTITTPLPDKTDKYIQRVILADGQNLHDVFTPVANFKKGKLNIISTKDFGTKDSQYTFLLDLVDECGIYIKWLNGCGGWSYWLFNKQHRIVHSSKSLGTINNNAGQLSYASDELNLGFDADKKLQVVAQYLEPWALEQLLDISVSPCLYVYMKPKGSLAYTNGDTDVWLKIPSITDFKMTEQSEAKNHKVSFEFQLPKIYTQTL